MVPAEHRQRTFYMKYMCWLCLVGNGTGGFLCYMKLRHLPVHRALVTLLHQDVVCLFWLPFFPQLIVLGALTHRALAKCFFAFYRIRSGI